MVGIQGGHSQSQNVTAVVDRNAPDVVVKSFQTPHDFINKQTTTDGYDRMRLLS